MTTQDPHAARCICSHPWPDHVTWCYSSGCSCRFTPASPPAIDPHVGLMAWPRGHGQGDWCRVHGVIDSRTSVRQHILDQHPDIDYERHLERAIANVATPPAIDLELREALAALEHQQWATWAEALMATEAISEERSARWKRLIHRPYEQLSEEEKADDRRWADRVLTALAVTPPACGHVGVEEAIARGQRMLAASEKAADREISRLRAALAATPPAIDPERLACEKCGNVDLGVAWHEGGWASSKRRSCGYGDTATVSGEHLHYHCRRCSYDWAAIIAAYEAET